MRSLKSQATILVGIITILSCSAEYADAAKHRPSQQRHKRVRKVPLSIRMLNPCAISHSARGQRGASQAFEMIRAADIPAFPRDKDSRGNTVIRFTRWSDGIEACKQFQLNSFYANLTLEQAIHRWDGGHTWRGYAKYIQRRTNLPLRGRSIRSLGQDHSLLIQAQAEWESGRVQPGRMRRAELSRPPRA